MGGNAKSYTTYVNFVQKCENFYHHGNCGRGKSQKSCVTKSGVSPRVLHQ